MKKYIVCVTEAGKIIKFSSDQLPQQSRKGIGVKAMMVREGDRIVSAFVVEE